MRSREQPRNRDGTVTSHQHLFYGCMTIPFATSALDAGDLARAFPALKWVSAGDGHGAPAEHGVYAWIGAGGNVLYVGSASAGGGPPQTFGHSSDSSQKSGSTRHGGATSRIQRRDCGPVRLKSRRRLCSHLRRPRNRGNSPSIFNLAYGEHSTGQREWLGLD
jgi:hypothetical protein